MHQSDQIRRTRADRRGPRLRGFTLPPLQENSNVADQYSSPNNLDVAWLQDHATRPKD